MKLLVKTKRGVHIREKSQENGAEPEKVHPTKLKTWAAFAKASHNATGGSMEDVIASVINEMKGVAFKNDKQALPVTQDEYEELIFQATNKGISKKVLDSLVVIVASKKPSIADMVEDFIKNK